MRRGGHGRNFNADAVAVVGQQVVVETAGRKAPLDLLRRGGDEAVMQRGEPGLYHVEGNTAGLSLFDLATALARLKSFKWTVNPSDEPVRDNRMQDERVPVRQVKDRLN